MGRRPHVKPKSRRNGERGRKAKTRPEAGFYVAAEGRQRKFGRLSRAGQKGNWWCGLRPERARTSVFGGNGAAQGAASSRPLKLPEYTAEQGRATTGCAVGKGTPNKKPLC